MFTVAVAGLPALTPAGSVPKPSNTDSSSSSTLSSVAVNVMLFFGVAAVERYTRVGRHTRIVAIRGPALVGLVDRNLSPLRSGSALRMTLTTTLLPSPTVYARLLIAHRHRRHVVIGDVHRRHGRAARAHPSGQRAKAQRQTLDSSSSSTLSSVAANVNGSLRCRRNVERYRLVNWQATP